MSTFNGIVKEFPNIRIDYFRTQANKPPPQACFLSHVHSDHLLGLESLKMPFVYCSATTRRLLLRMEKYPHRINFAKGILETRKQHYRHLKGLLRALPLQTATELELSAKSRIRVTLFDANHCPGAVMFLIEDENRAILYTGDVRAEPWWVNSIIQNPFLLPYACGLKTLDCLYLDTTFSTQDDAYRHFPTKAEGLKELLTKVAQFPQDTIFYFRAWTLGYEAVWTALSNSLRNLVHVDDYQLNMFSGIVENGHDGYSMFEGPALIGFPVGNECFPGCLSRDPQTRLHSCEPGMPCHTELKKQDVVCITPIISRLDDGTEILELGAGGGVGDLQQSSDLELPDVETLEAFLQFCEETVGESTSLEKIHKMINNMKRTRLDKISLSDLELDAYETLPLKQFAQLFSKVADDVQEPRKLKHNAATNARVIHFPYSRHSSYEELRHLVSIFRPKDICPCTVDLEIWSAEMSMRSLFGDLCSEIFYYHDKEIEMSVQELREYEAVRRNLKRKRPDDSQETEEADPSQHDDFQSARASLARSSEHRDQKPRAEVDLTTAEESPISQHPLQALMPKQRTSSPGLIKTRKKEQIESAFRALNRESDLITRAEFPESVPQTPNVVGPNSEQSLSTSAFDSLPLPINNTDSLPQVDGADVEAFSHPEESVGETRRAVRRDAHRAARKALWESECGHWNDLRLRSVGRNGHTEAEVEL